MNINDSMKFVKIFVDVYKDNDLVKPTRTELEGILNKVDSNYLDAWEKYLYRKSNEIIDEDEWDNFYDGLENIESIGDKDLAIFDLPTSKIRVILGDLESLARKIYELAKDYIDKTKGYCTKDSNMHVSYEFMSTGIYVSFYSKKQNYKNRKLINNEWNTFNETAKSYIKDFNTKHESTDGMVISSNYYRNDEAILGATTARSFIITIEDLVYTTKSIVEQKYLDEFFCIEDKIDLPFATY